jgi:hypothetical protein
VNAIQILRPGGIYGFDQGMGVGAPQYFPEKHARHLKIDDVLGLTSCLIRGVEPWKPFPEDV